MQDTTLKSHVSNQNSTCKLLTLFAWFSDSEPRYSQRPLRETSGEREEDREESGFSARDPSPVTLSRRGYPREGQLHTPGSPSARDRNPRRGHSSG